MGKLFFLILAIYELLPSLVRVVIIMGSSETLVSGYLFKMTFWKVVYEDSDFNVG